MSMSSQDLNKVFAAVLLAALIAMLTSFIARQLVTPEHELETAHYPVPKTAGEPETTTTETEAEPEGPEPIVPLLASASPEQGQKVFRACQACHSPGEGGSHQVGPNLWNVVMSDIARHDDFNYSDALAGLDGQWTYARLNEFLANPKGYAPGTRMTFAGLKTTQDRADLVAWLRLQSPDPAPLPEAGTAEAAAETVAETVGAADSAGPEASADTAEIAGGETVAETAGAPTEPSEPAQAEATEMAERTATDAGPESGSAETGPAADAGQPAETSETVAAAEDQTAETGGRAAADAAAAAADQTAETGGAAAESGAAESGAGDAGEPDSSGGDLSPLQQRLVSADVQAGQGEFRACQACHLVDQSGRHRIGPNLWGIVLSEKARHDDFRYSNALKSLDGRWTYENLDGFIQNPRGYAPGTRMTYGGLKDDQDRANLIAWLRTQSDDPAPLP